MTEIRHGSWTPDIQDGDIYLGKYWAALDSNKVVRTIKMSIPEHIDFEKFRAKSFELLELFGDVRSGHIVNRDGQNIFIRRLTHQSRTKSARQPKEYIVDERI